MPKCQHADKAAGCNKPTSGRAMMLCAFGIAKPFWAWVDLCEEHMPTRNIKDGGR